MRQLYVEGARYAVRGWIKFDEQSVFQILIYRSISKTMEYSMSFDSPPTRPTIKSGSSEMKSLSFNIRSVYSISLSWNSSKQTSSTLERATIFYKSMITKTRSKTNLTPPSSKSPPLPALSTNGTFFQLNMGEILWTPRLGKPFLRSTFLGRKG